MIYSLIEKKKQVPAHTELLNKISTMVLQQNSILEKKKLNKIKNETEMIASN